MDAGRKDPDSRQPKWASRRSSLGSVASFYDNESPHANDHYLFHASPVQHKTFAVVLPGHANESADDFALDDILEAADEGSDVAEKRGARAQKVASRTQKQSKKPSLSSSRKKISKRQVSFKGKNNKKNAGLAPRPAARRSSPAIEDFPSTGAPAPRTNDAERSVRTKTASASTTKRPNPPKRRVRNPSAPAPAKYRTPPQQQQEDHHAYGSWEIETRIMAEKTKYRRRSLQGGFKTSTSTSRMAVPRPSGYNFTEAEFLALEEAERLAKESRKARPPPDDGDVPYDDSPILFGARHGGAGDGPGTDGDVAEDSSSTDEEVIGNMVEEWQKQTPVFLDVPKDAEDGEHILVKERFKTFAYTFDPAEREFVANLRCERNFHTLHQQRAFTAHPLPSSLSSNTTKKKKKKGPSSPLAMYREREGKYTGKGKGAFVKKSSGKKKTGTHTHHWTKTPSPEARDRLLRASPLPPSPPPSSSKGKAQGQGAKTTNKLLASPRTKTKKANKASSSSSSSPAKSRLRSPSNSPTRRAGGQGSPMKARRTITPSKLKRGRSSRGGFGTSAASHRKEMPRTSTSMASYRLGREVGANLVVL